MFVIRCHVNAVKGFWGSWYNINERVVTTVAMVMLLREFGPYGITFMTCVYYFSVIVGGQCTSKVHNWQREKQVQKHRFLSYLATLFQLQKFI
jgi:hypothetical protein